MANWSCSFWTSPHPLVLWWSLHQGELSACSCLSLFQTCCHTGPTQTNSCNHMKKLMVHIVILLVWFVVVTGVSTHQIVLVVSNRNRFHPLVIMLRSRDRCPTSVRIQPLEVDCCWVASIHHQLSPSRILVRYNGGGAVLMNKYF